MRHVTPPTASLPRFTFPALSPRVSTSALTPFITPPALPPWPPPPLARRADDDGDGVDDAQRATAAKGILFPSVGPHFSARLNDERGS